MQALRERNFALLFAARTISFFGTNLVPIALAFAVLDLTGSATDVGIVFAARTVAQVATLAVGGVVADRLPRRLVMIGADGASLAVQTAMGTLLVTGHARVWELVGLHAALGAAAAFHAPASSGLVPQTVPAQLLQQANGSTAIARYSATVVGAAVGGALVATIGSGWAVLLDGATFATSAVLLSGLRLGAETRAAGARFLRDLADGWQAFTEHTWIWVGTLWISLFFLVTYAPFFVLGRTSRSSRCDRGRCRRLWLRLLVRHGRLGDDAPAARAARAALARGRLQLDGGDGVPARRLRLWIAAGWIVVTTALLLQVPDVRNLRRDEAPEAAPAPAL